MPRTEDDPLAQQDWRLAVARSVHGGEDSPPDTGYVAEPLGYVHHTYGWFISADMVGFIWGIILDEAEASAERYSRGRERYHTAMLRATGAQDAYVVPDTPEGRGKDPYRLARIHCPPTCPCRNENE